MGNESERVSGGHSREAASEQKLRSLTECANGSEARDIKLTGTQPQGG